MTEVPNIFLNFLIFLDLLKLEKTQLFKNVENLLYIVFLSTRIPLVYLIWSYSLHHFKNGNFWELDLSVKICWFSCCLVLDALNVIWAIDMGKGKQSYLSPQLM